MPATYFRDDPALGRIEYRDRRRWLWLGSVVNPVIGFTGIGLHLATGNEAFLLTPLAIAYLLGPLLDWWLGEDENNPPEAIVPQLEADPYYRVLTWLAVPLHYVALVGAAWWVGTQALSWWAYLAVAYAAGLGSGLGINTGHELGHKNTRLEQWLAKLVLAVPAYGHFCVEHNRGHHRHVATPEDPASARMGESIYRFALREVPGAMRRAWALERARLARAGRSVWHADNAILQSGAITGALQGGLLAAFGWKLLPFLVIHNLVAWWQLTSANYVEHYGLLRRRLPDGRYERPQPHHSWNANHTYTNLMLFQLERHSDHHANPSRRYQCLRNFPDLPRLPSGYQGMFPIAYLPWLWYRVMDPRLMALEQVAGDLERVNVDPRRREALYRRYGRPPRPPATSSACASR
ncbi:alkane 1-monooxygenase [Quisquiliibacterium transsilvanicum]|uniref:Alkane 1-monooxygenase n=1 Tax=Quisquiliibacterium transsilvanicum TaxID=1549638 RepID=A0A7W8M905_9BURK|nr:alkane 1-monooxygenase [Quisquiliibacterium transsilvanicum]MBB5272353.1 alkane 1-monooxygenase [Quisquiliibacterium transsilvanicum]